MIEVKKVNSKEAVIMAYGKEICHFRYDAKTAEFYTTIGGKQIRHFDKDEFVNACIYEYAAVKASVIGRQKWVIETYNTNPKAKARSVFLGWVWFNQTLFLNNTQLDTVWYVVSKRNECPLSVIKYGKDEAHYSTEIGVTLPPTMDFDGYSLLIGYLPKWEVATTFDPNDIYIHNADDPDMGFYRDKGTWVYGTRATYVEAIRLRG